MRRFANSISLIKRERAVKTIMIRNSAWQASLELETLYETLRKIYGETKREEINHSEPLSVN